MLPGMELMACQGMAVPVEVMQHVIRVESSHNPYAIGVVGAQLVRQPRSLGEALATVRMLESTGRNFSVGLAQVNRANLASQGLQPYERAFDACANVVAGSRILADCHARSGGDWGKAFSCYYSGNFETGFRHGYVQKVFESMGVAPGSNGQGSRAIPLARTTGTSGSGRRHPDEGRPKQEDDTKAGHLVVRRTSVAQVVVEASSVAAPPMESRPQPVSGAPPSEDGAFVF
jgi:type IV secretion system protein VirB1